MVHDLEEQEKLDAMKAWWGRYGTFVLTLIAVVALTVGGWSSWKAYQDYRANQAMGYFEALEDAARLSDADAAARVKVAAETLRKDYLNTGYAARGALIAAQALVEQKDIDGARQQLEWLAGQSNQVALQPLSCLRLASLLLDQKQYDQALAQLANPPAAFAGLYADRRGDILAAQGKRDAAAAAWHAALAALQPDSSLKHIIQLKLDALGGV